MSVNKALFLTNEFPPNIYGGAGVHVDYLSRELAREIAVDVRCFGDQNVSGPPMTVRGADVPAGLLDQTPDKLRSPVGMLARSVHWLSRDIDADVVHCHTWYSHFAGVACKLLYGTPLLLTTHSLEPLRPWKREQIGRGYDFSSWVERTAIEMADAVIAVSQETKQDVLAHFDVDESRLHVIPNGIDLDEYAYTEQRDGLEKYGVPTDAPYVLFVGRITRQKGIVHLLSAIEKLESDACVVLCAGAPDTEEIAREMNERVDHLKKTRGNVIWIEEMVSREVAIQLYSHARVFCCPSIYEPFGIINLEAMACRTAVVASAVGGIKEVVVDGQTGTLVPFEARGDSATDGQAPFEPKDADAFAAALAKSLDAVLADEALAQRYGEAGRARVEERFSWRAVAAEVLALYNRCVA